ncbi:hypothetical protein TWF481_002549 [Arthrobotrys musiformis]|uniref:Uncharacterized protein n=1 Tax=Arthrobotrys musiformis TaxID=47236 RepID=A0AAV9VSJ9_9PEZI
MLVITSPLTSTMHPALRRRADFICSEVVSPLVKALSDPEHMKESKKCQFSASVLFVETDKHTTTQPTTEALKAECKIEEPDEQQVDSTPRQQQSGEAAGCRKLSSEAKRVLRPKSSVPDEIPPPETPARYRNMKVFLR